MARIPGVDPCQLKACTLARGHSGFHSDGSPSRVAPPWHPETPTELDNPVDISPAIAEPYEFVTMPPHYAGHPSGVECQIIIRECKDPLVAFAIKHLWRTQWGGKPGQTKEQDLKKVIEYCQLELARVQGKDRL